MQGIPTVQHHNTDLDDQIPAVKEQLIKTFSLPTHCEEPGAEAPPKAPTQDPPVPINLNTTPIPRRLALRRPTSRVRESAINETTTSKQLATTNAGGFANVGVPNPFPNYGAGTTMPFYNPQMPMQQQWNPYYQAPSPRRKVKITDPKDD